MEITLKFENDTSEDVVKYLRELADAIENQNTIHPENSFNGKITDFKVYKSVEEAKKEHPYLD